MRQEKKVLQNCLELPNGIPSHDTIQRVFAMVPSEFLENFQKQWNEMLNSDEGNKIERLLAIDGKTQRGNGSKNQKANHIVSAVDGKGFCLGRKRVEEKTNEIKAIPELLDCLNIKGTIITTDAMGTQTDDISWLSRKKEWTGLKTVILTRNTVIGKEGEASTEERYYISSLPTVLVI